MAISTTRDTSARIRILPCEPVPAPRAARRWPLVVVAASVGVVGVAGTMVLVPRPQPTAVAPPVEAPVALLPSATADVASFRHTTQVHRTIRTATSADLPAAAVIARRAVVTKPTQAVVTQAVDEIAVPASVPAERPPAVSAPPQTRQPATSSEPKGQPLTTEVQVVPVKPDPPKPGGLPDQPGMPDSP